jgi:hypothetical protein
MSDTNLTAILKQKGDIKLVCMTRLQYLLRLSIYNTCSLHIKLFNLPARGTCANGIFTSPPLKFTSPPYQDNFVQGLDQRLK